MSIFRGPIFPCNKVLMVDPNKLSLAPHLTSTICFAVEEGNAVKIKLEIHPFLPMQSGPFNGL